MRAAMASGEGPGMPGGGISPALSLARILAQPSRLEESEEGWK